MDQSKQIITDVNLLAYQAMLAELRYALPGVDLMAWIDLKIIITQ